MRAPGIPNKKTKEVCDLIDKAKLGPLEFLIAVLSLDYEALSIESAKKVQWTNAGIEYEVDAIPVELRMDAAKTLMKYRYSQKQAVEHSTGESGIKIFIEDYTK
jgi:hypothetical protein